MALKQIDHGGDFYKKMVALRYDLLRKPLGLSFSDEELAQEKDDILIVCVEDDNLLGCCMLTKVDDTCLRLRQMAVKKNLQGRGIGESIMHFAETLSRDKGYKKIVLHARDQALGFYKKMHYDVQEPQFTEVGIPHYLMEKTL